MKSATSSWDSPSSVRCLWITSSYSRIRATESWISNLCVPTRDNSLLDAPLLERRAAMMTFVSRTISGVFILVLYATSYVISTTQNLIFARRGLTVCVIRMPLNGTWHRRILGTMPPGMRFVPSAHCLSRSAGIASVIPFHGDVIRLGDHGADFFKSLFTWRKHTEEMLRRIIGVRHNDI